MLVVLGVDYPRVELAPLAALATAATSIPVLNQAGDAVCLSTCNRVELYLDAAAPEDAVRRVSATWALQAGWSPADLEALIVREDGPAVARHLLEVASGLRSIVLGEVEIGGQVARALADAHDRGTTTPLLEALFQAACRTARRVAAETELGRAGRSIGSVALDLAGAANQSALIVGTGAFARVVAAELRARGCTNLSVLSPTGRSQEFARSHAMDVVEPDCLGEALAATDLVVLCSGHGTPVLTRQLVADRPASAGRLAVLDLSLRRDAEPGLGELPGVHLVDLAAVAAACSPVSAETRQAAESIVSDELERFSGRWRAREVDPAIIALRRHIEQVTRSEIERLPGAALPPEQVGLLVHRISQKLAHEPTVRARRFGAAGRTREYLAALDIVYGLADSSPHAEV